MPGAHHHLSASAETIHWGFFDAQLQPVLTLRSGDTITIDTISGGPEILKDCPYAILPEHPAVLKALTPKLGLHILTGPVAVEGAAPGDMLEVQIEKIELAAGLGMEPASSRSSARCRRTFPSTGWCICRSTAPE